MKVGLYGGSFNPPHHGHKFLAEVALKRFQLDQIWWMVTPGNPLKDKGQLQPLEVRIEQSRRLIRHPHIHVTGFEASLRTRAFFEKVDTGFSQKNATNQEIRAVDYVNKNKNRSNHSAETIALIRQMRPRVNFVWLMGADNLESFHLWQQWRMIAAQVGIGIIDRPGASFAALASPAARALARFRLPEAQAPLLARTQPPAWCFLHTPRLDISSTSLRSRS